MIVTMSTSCQSRRCAIRDSGMGAILRPRRRAVDRAAMRPDGYHVGELAFRRKVARDVLVVGGHSAKFLAGSFVWIEYDNGFSCALLEVVEFIGTGPTKPLKILRHLGSVPIFEIPPCAIRRDVG